MAIGDARTESLLRGLLLFAGVNEDRGICPLELDDADPEPDPLPDPDASR
jgi:hypothetical protein